MSQENVDDLDPSGLNVVQLSEPRSGQPHSQLGHRDARFTFRVYQRAAKRRERLDWRAPRGVR